MLVKMEAKTDINQGNMNAWIAEIGPWWKETTAC
jgi:hypothetical protein